MVIRNGVPLFDSGKLTVIDVTDTINVVITWNTNERLTELSGRKVRDLAITKVMRWDPATFETSEDNDFKWVAETGYKQAGADGIMNYNARGFRPAVKAFYLLAALLPGLTPLFGLPELAACRLTAIPFSPVQNANRIRNHVDPQLCNRGRYNQKLPDSPR